MKSMLVILPFIFYVPVVCAQDNTFSWMEGAWSRTNTKPGKSNHEYWTRLSDKEWSGLGVTLSGTDTVFVEKLKLVKKDGIWYYVADVPENKELIYFKMTTIDGQSFVCENPQHDFPKKISYARKDNGLQAIISADGKSFEYLFERK